MIRCDPNVDADAPNQSLTLSVNEYIFFTDTAVEIELQGEFSFGEHDSCTSVAYLGVELVQGDSDEVKDLDADVSENNVRFAHMSLKCIEGMLPV